MLNLELPIVQAPKAGVQGSELCIAVSEAGGHRGMFLSEDVTTQAGSVALWPQVVNAVDIPVIAAGGIVNRIIRELGPLGDDVVPFPLASIALGPLRKAAEARGRTDFTSLWSGQNASGCREIAAAEQLRRLAAKL